MQETGITELGIRMVNLLGSKWTRKGKEEGRKARRNEGKKTREGLKGGSQEEVECNSRRTFEMEWKGPEDASADPYLYNAHPE